MKNYEYSIMWGCSTAVKDWKSIAEMIPTFFIFQRSSETDLCSCVLALFTVSFLLNPFFPLVIFILCGYVALCALRLKCYVASMFWSSFCTSLVTATTRTRQGSDQYLNKGASPTHNLTPLWACGGNKTVDKRYRAGNRCLPFFAFIMLHIAHFPSSSTVSRLW